MKWNKKFHIIGNFLLGKYVIRVKMVFAYEELKVNNYPSYGNREGKNHEGDRI